ncbi:hypothetical protein HMPREF9241_00891 [Schaalia turicensis ACS-279-V-Col4]|uniref:Uncharacterized protein n=1 Tax=Schaalia turicensis ACS-279-V-Col4 TaxID=883077 RepID=K0YRP5_9ACTO|nr:hypothetical protein HMPREF9241_00891 [Schaalia turicensis ACS-279-V-Col4]
MKVMGTAKRWMLWDEVAPKAPQWPGLIEISLE